MEDVPGDIASMDNNSKGKNAHAKAGFSTYNDADANVDTGAGAADTSGIRDASSLGGPDNNVDNKNAYIKADFNTYNVASINTGASASDAIVTGEKVGSNRNNTVIGQSKKMGGANKGEMGENNKGKMGGANIKADKKAGIEAIASINNSADGGNKVTDLYAGFASLRFAAFAAANCAGNSNLAALEGTLLSATTSILNEFLTTFATLANTTLKRKPKMYKSNPFLFATNHQ